VVVDLNLIIRLDCWWWKIKLKTQKIRLAVLDFSSYLRWFIFCFLQEKMVVFKGLVEAKLNAGVGNGGGKSPKIFIWWWIGNNVHFC